MAAIGAIIIFCLLCIVRIAISQDSRAVDPENHFTFPPLPGNQYSHDQTVFWTNINITYGAPLDRPFSWVTNLESVRIRMQQEGPGGTSRGREIISQCWK